MGYKSLHNKVGNDEKNDDDLAIKIAQLFLRKRQAKNVNKDSITYFCATRYNFPTYISPIHETHIPFLLSALIVTALPSSAKPSSRFFII